MAIEILPAELAFETLQANPLARWPGRDHPERLHPLAEPVAQGAWRLRGDERVFCIGSCFAREVENAFRDLGFDVLSIMRNLPRSANRTRSDRGFNKYNVATMLNELRWALGDGAPYRHADVLLGLPGDALLQDGQLGGSAYLDDARGAEEFRDAYNAAFRAIRDADLVVLTLGLSEAWKDTATGLYLNHAPTRELVAAYPGRFELHVLDHAETLAMLLEIDRLLTTHLRPGFRLLLTVSPVPLLSTFRDQDVLVANAYSKSVLRSTVDAFLVGRAHASYFPAYEFVTLSNPLVVWRHDDFRHVSGAFVRYIMASVLVQMGTAPEAARQARERLRAEISADMRHQLAGAAEGLARAAAGDTPLALAGRLRSLRKRWANWLRERRRRNEPALPTAVLERWDGRTLSGWAFLKTQAEAVRVTVWIGDRQIAAAAADLARPDVAQVHGTERLYSGFQIALPAGVEAGSSMRVLVEGRLLKTLTAAPREAAAPIAGPLS